MDVDVVIVGGGIAGLWALDALARSGYRAVLVENRALGYGQTITSQGIIHGGLKYSLRGVLTASAHEIREMPIIWRECLSGQSQPDLSTAAVRSHCCYLWQTDALASQAGMWGAKLSLRVKPQLLKGSKRPELLQAVPGNVYQLNEQVISPGSVLQCLRDRNQDAVLLCDTEQGLEFSKSSTGAVNSVTVRHQNEELFINTGCVVLCGGAGNEQLNDLAGRKQAMQRRPLQMVLVRGDLPMFQGHCVDGSKTRLTITSEQISRDHVIWQLGGQIAEQGASMTTEDLVAHAASELAEVLPELNLDQLEFATYLVDRAEKKITMGLRPDSPQVLRHKNVITCWPTKLAFAPRAAQMIEKKISKELLLSPINRGDELSELTQGWVKPPVASSPWETVEQWYRIATPNNQSQSNVKNDHAA